MAAELAAAVRNNAEWCDAVCRRHGLPTAWHPDAWIARRRTPEFYPDAVTLVPGAAPEAVLARIDASPGCSVKDSFATLDLAPYGFRVLFAAEWICRDVPADPDPDPGWQRRGDALVGPGASVMANRSATVVGLSNLEVTTMSLDAAWAGAVAAVGAAHPGLPIVGYERDDDLATARRAGFRTLGPLRVWIRDA